MLKSNKIIFCNFLMLGTLISISSCSWIGMWMGLEINLLSIIPLMINNKNKFSSEAMMKYFSSQALASMILLFSILNLFVSKNLFLYLMFLNSALLMKMGAAPFHFWFPPVMDGLNWNISFIMLTWQKIAPFTIMSYNLDTLNLFYFAIIFSSSIGSILGLNQISLRKVMAYSSINHISWMLASLLNSSTLWATYFLIYTLISLNIVWIFNIYNIFFIKQLINKISNKNLKFLFMLNFLSLGGLPPFLGFLPKWMTINSLMTQNLWLMNLIIIMFSLITLFFYIRIASSSLMLNSQENFLLMNKYPNMKMSFINLISILSLIFSVNVFNLT